MFKLANAPAALRSVIQNFGWMLASRGLAAVFSLVNLVIITRSLGVSGFGRFALITGAAQLLASLLAFQTWQIIVQYGVKHIANGDEGKLARLYRASVVLDLISVIVGAATSALILHFFAEALGLKPTLARATLIFNIIILLSMRSTPVGVMRLRDRFSMAAAADSALPTLRLVGAIIVWWIHPKLQGFLIAWAIAEMLAALAHWYAVYKIGDLKLFFTKSNDLGKVIDDNPDIVRFSLSTNFSQSLNITSKQLPLFLVGGLNGIASAGAFRLAAQLARSLTVLSQMIARAAFPEIVRAVHHNGVTGLGNMILRTLRVAFAVSAVVYALVVLAGAPVLELVGGPDFRQGYPALLWLAGAACIDLAVVAFEPSIQAVRRSQQSFYARLAGTVVMIGGSFALEPSMGAYGVAAAVFAGALTQALLLGVFVARLIAHGRAGQPAGPVDAN